MQRRSHVGPERARAAAPSLRKAECCMERVVSAALDSISSEAPRRVARVSNHDVRCEAGRGRDDEGLVERVVGNCQVVGHLLGVAAVPQQGRGHAPPVNGAGDRDNFARRCRGGRSRGARQRRWRGGSPCAARRISPEPVIPRPERVAGPIARSWQQRGMRGRSWRSGAANCPGCGENFRRGVTRSRCSSG